ncbi:hypothetical protein J437_LFUL000796, partial [Ladona fulva]
MDMVVTEEGADYWKSQAKKYCDFCKCWLADNKPSIEFHEKGKRHKENVQKRLGEITKKSVKEEKDRLKVDAEIKKMEKAAMKAYLKDVEENPDFTSHMLQEMGTLPKSLEVSQPSTAASPSVESGSNAKKKKNKNSDHHKQNVHNSFKNSGKKSSSRNVEVQPVVFGPAPKGDPYGSWKAVEPSVSTIDLQLPEQKNLMEYNVPDLSEEPKIKFKEKKVESLGESSSVSFKKRKINNSQKRN